MLQNLHFLRRRMQSISKAFSSMNEQTRSYIYNIINNMKERDIQWKIKTPLEVFDNF